MVEAKNLTKKYGKRIVVENLSFTLEPGKIYGFLGVNGAGKSTTMNMLTGYLACTAGEVIINGHDMAKEPEEAKRCIGYLPETAPVYPDMTVYEYLKFTAELKKIPKQNREQEIEKAMERTKSAEVSERLIKNLSKGYRQRVGLAQAILGNPEVIVLDEPMAGLDPRQIIEMRDLLKELGKEHTVILSSHILSEISEICDQIMILSGRKLFMPDMTREGETLEEIFLKLTGEESDEASLAISPEAFSDKSGIQTDVPSSEVLANEAEVQKEAEHAGNL